MTGLPKPFLLDPLLREWTDRVRLSVFQADSIGPSIILYGVADVSVYTCQHSIRSTKNRQMRILWGILPIHLADWITWQSGVNGPSSDRPKRRAGCACSVLAERTWTTHPPAQRGSANVNLLCRDGEGLPTTRSICEKRRVPEWGLR